MLGHHLNAVLVARILCALTRVQIQPEDVHCLKGTSIPYPYYANLRLVATLIPNRPVIRVRIDVMPSACT